MNYTFLLAICSRKKKKQKKTPNNLHLKQDQTSPSRCKQNSRPRLITFILLVKGWAGVGWEPGHLALPWAEHTFSQERLCDAKVLVKESLGREIPWEPTKLTSLVFAVWQQRRGKQ